MDIKELYKNISIDGDNDAKTTLHRFGGNSGLLERFVKKFPSDYSYKEILSTSEAKDISGMERSAHTLKGTSANLGFQALSDRCSDLVRTLREGKTESEEFAPLVQAISEEYDQIIALIGRLD